MPNLNFTLIFGVIYDFFWSIQKNVVNLQSGKSYTASSPQIPPGPVRSKGRGLSGAM